MNTNNEFREWLLEYADKHTEKLRRAWAEYLVEHTDKSDIIDMLLNGQNPISYDSEELANYISDVFEQDMWHEFKRFRSQYIGEKS